MNSLVRGFPMDEYRRRLARAQKLMQEADIDALLLTTQPEFYYFTGFLTRFWESPSRPWFLVIPGSGKPIAVIPSIGAQLMGKTWVEDIRTWRSPDLKDDGITLLAETLLEVAGNGKVGLPDGHETHVRMPFANLTQLERLMEPASLASDDGIIRRLRLVKSQAEIDKISAACDVAGRAFARVHEIAKASTQLDVVFRKFQMLCLEEGADWVPYLAGGAGPNGYDDVISPASEVPLQVGDLLMLDTGLVWDGYFCDFDRNFSIGMPSQNNQSAYAKLIEATHAGFETVKPGASASQVFHAMDRIVTNGKGGSDAGRLGHGLGLQLTESPSLIPDDHTIFEPGMVLTLEPGIETQYGNMLVHEENIVVTETGAEFLSPRADLNLPIIG